MKNKGFSSLRKAKAVSSIIVDIVKHKKDFSTKEQVQDEFLKRYNEFLVNNDYKKE